MTREEAKHRLLSIERCTPIHTREDARDFEALEMAIQALSQEPTDTWSIKDVADTFKKHGLIREQEPTDKPMCDRNICLNNEYNGIGCEECIVNKAESGDKE